MHTTLKLSTLPVWTINAISDDISQKYFVANVYRIATPRSQATNTSTLYSCTLAAVSGSTINTRSTAGPPLAGSSAQTKYNRSRPSIAPPVSTVFGAVQMIWNTPVHSYRSTREPDNSEKIVVRFIVIPLCALHEFMSSLLKNNLSIG